ncbi:hypothetical protein I4U23_003632 [Adineta vaga]|nr:hypothetical protein I4U23_003632 [Adineta vaga]
MKECCSEHDTCYETCGKTLDSCDDAFGSCLNSTCEELGGWFQWVGEVRQAAFKLNVNMLYNIVDTFGGLFYKIAQKKVTARYNIHRVYTS